MTSSDFITQMNAMSSLPSTVTNSTPTTLVITNPQRPNWQIALEIFTACLLWLLSIFGNVLVILVVHRSRRLQSTTNYFVVSLSFADLCMALLCMPFILGRVVAHQWLFGVFICKLVRFLQYMAPGATVYVLLAIGVDRFYTIIYPLSFKITRGKAKRMIGISWIVSVILSCPAFFFFNLSNVGSSWEFCDTFISHHTAGVMYTAFIVLVEYLLPSVLIVLIYAKIIKHIWNVGISGRTVQRTMNAVPRTKVKTVKMLMIVTAVYFLSWTPFFITQLVYSSLNPPYVDPTIYIACVWIAFASSASNPIIYAYYNSNFRRGCKEVFCMSTMRCYRSNTYAITNPSRFARKNHVGIAPGSIDMNGTSARPVSPYKSFDRDANGDKKMAWPLPAGGSTTYL
ncbi:probable G-protein coupled receptor 19 [Amphiura filiformis]|uniref:probable G-protein coupled receptor 19 n=1 Tax=Amphiura filiformis TaxID=82378 RepID=UPI003B21B141